MVHRRKSRSRGRVAWILLGCAAALFLLVLLIGLVGGGLDKTVKAQALAELNSYNQARQQFTLARSAVEKSLESDPQLFAAQSLATAWKERLEAASKKLTGAAAAETRLRALVEENDNEKRAEVEQATRQLASARLTALAEAADIRNAADRLIEFKKQVDKKLPEMEKTELAIRDFDLTPVKAKVDRAATDWPNKKADLESRLAVYTAAQAEAARAWKSATEARQRVKEKKLAGADVELLARLADRLSEIRTSLASSGTQLGALIDQLYWSWDKILIDMDIQEGSEVAFRQKFRTTRIRVQPEVDEKKAPETKKTEAWETVGKAVFESMKDKLGMVVVHKEAGKFDQEATRLVQPPGYAYMCPPQQQRNRYGYWERRQGRSFWHFYGQYAFMRAMMGPSRYYPTGTMYRDYNTHARSGRTYFGRDQTGAQLYGSKGAATRQTFASSKYVSTGGLKTTKYVQSGGKYRGSRYERAATATRRSSYRSSSYRSSYRSSGSRSSFGGK